MASTRPVEPLELRTLFAFAGELDPTFAGDGIAFHPDGFLSDVTVQSDGKVLLFGAENVAGRDLVLRRLLADGSPDPSFGPVGAGGVVRIDLGGNEAAGEVLSLPDGKILLAASTSGPSSSQAAVVRLLEDGSFDPSFGTGGKVLLSPRTHAWLNDVAVQPDGKVVVAGGTWNGASPVDTDALLARLLPDGALDTGFGAGGFVTANAGNSDSLSGLAIDSRGYLITSAVTDMSFGRGDLVVFRFDAAGAPDVGFGDGFGRFTVEDISDGAGDVLAVAHDGIVVSYHHTGGPQPGPVGHALLRLNDRGERVADFGFDGVSVTEHYSRVNGTSVSELALQADHKIVLGGTGLSEVMLDNEGDPVRFMRMVALRFDQGGRLDWAFGAEGPDGATVLELDTDPETNAEGQGRSVAIAPDGKIVLGGWGFIGTTAGTAAARLLAEPPRTLPIELLSDGTVLVTGTPSDDVVSIRASEVVGRGPVVSVALNGAAVDFDRSAVQGVRVLGKAGGDEVTVDGTLALPVHVDGGPDYALQFDSVTVTGTEGSDATTAGTSVVAVGSGATVSIEGTEVVFLELLGGDDTLETLPGDGGFLLRANGGAGNDAATLRGRTGVVFTGGDGDDTHTVYGGWSQFFAGAGNDSAFYQGRDDSDDRVLYSTATTADPPEVAYSGALLSEMSEDDSPVGPLDFEGLESLRIDLRGGDDRLLVVNNLRTALTVEGGDGNDHVTHSDARDIPGTPPLQLSAAGLSGREGGYAPVGTSGFESVALQGVYGVTSVVVTPDEAARFEVFVDAPWPPEPPSADNTVGVDLAGGAAGVRLTRGPEEGSGTFEFANRRPVVYRNFGTVDTVAARHVVYDAATTRETVAAGKTPLRPGQLASFANVTSYSKGINGAYLDVIGLPQDATPESVLASLAFHRGGAQGGTEWTAAPAPSSVSIARGEGTGGSDRIRLAWHDNAIRNTWLRVTANGSPATGLTAPEQFYIGNLVGETGDSAGGAALTVTPIDFVLTRRALFSDAAINSRFDFNRDGRISPLDLAIVRSAQRNSLPLFIAGHAVPPPLAAASGNDPSPKEEEPSLFL